jgi:hypothetical protein
MNAGEKLRLLQADVDVFAGATSETRLDALPGWGSLAILLVIVHCEEKHHRVVTGAQVRGCRTVADLLLLLP